MTILFKIMLLSLLGVIVCAGYVAVWGMLEETELGEAIIKKVKLIRCKDCKYLPGKSRAYADDDPVETYIHCGHLGENGYCSFAKRSDE